MSANASLQHQWAAAEVAKGRVEAELDALGVKRAEREAQTVAGGEEAGSPVRRKKGKARAL